MGHGMDIAPNRVARVDRWRVRMDATIATDDRGFARIWGTVITADSLLEYGPMDGHEDGHVEFVPESTVFDQDSLATLRNSPITFLHPVEPVNSDNVSRVSVGHIIDVKRDGARLRALHQVEDARAIEKIAGGVIELSPGYTTELEDPGGLVVDGRTVSAIQRKRVYNHQAIVPEARAGHDNALTIDARILPADGLRIQKRGAVMASITIDGKTVEVDAESLAKIQELAGGLGKSDEGEGDKDQDELDEDGKKSDEDDDNADADSAAGKPSDAAEDAAKNEPVTPANDGKVDAAAIAQVVTASVLESLRKDRSDERAASSRTDSIISAARDALPTNFNFDGKSDEQIMRKAIAERDPDMVTAAKALQGDALFGFFKATVGRSATGARSDGKPIVQTRESYADAIEFRRKRIDAIAQSGFTGDAAVRCEPALKLVYGGKA